VEGRFSRLWENRPKELGLNCVLEQATTLCDWIMKSTSDWNRAVRCDKLFIEEKSINPIWGKIAATFCHIKLTYFLHLV
jgi:hypothetical protein